MARTEPCPVPKVQAEGAGARDLEHSLFSVVSLSQTHVRKLTAELQKSRLPGWAQQELLKHS